MDKWQYLHVLKQNLKASAEKLGIPRTFEFYADNDPKHTSYVAKKWLLHNCPKVLETLAQSPDLNVIEHLWDYLEKNIRKHEISDKEDLRKIIDQEWYKIASLLTEKLVRSMPSRLGAARKSRGYPTKY